MAEFRRDIPGQQFVDAVDGMFGDARQNVVQVTLGIDSIQLGCADQTVEYRSTLAASVRSSEQVVLPAERGEQSMVLAAKTLSLGGHRIGHSLIRVKGQKMLSH